MAKKTTLGRGKIVLINRPAGNTGIIEQHKEKSKYIDFDQPLGVELGLKENDEVDYEVCDVGGFPMAYAVREPNAFEFEQGTVDGSKKKDPKVKKKNGKTIDILQNHLKEAKFKNDDKILFTLLTSDDDNTEYAIFLRHVPKRKRKRSEKLRATS